MSAIPANPTMPVTPATRPDATTWHAAAWLSWAVASAVAIQIAPSPVYVAIIVGVAWLMVSAFAVDGPLARAFPLLVAISLVFSLVRIVLVAATTHGTGTVLFTAPAIKLPIILGGFTVGGPVILQVVLQAAAESFVIVGLVAVFGAFNAVVSHYELVQSVPRAFYELGLVVVVALTVVPSTIESVHETREADRARTGGRAVRRGRLVRQIIPVLERGMERAIALAESMDSRGFGRLEPSRGETQGAWYGLGALLLLGGAFVALVAQRAELALVLVIAGTVLLAVGVGLASRASGRPRYRHRHMTRADWAMALGAWLCPIGLGILRAVGEPSLVWVATPLAWPTTNLVAVLALVPLLAPLTRARAGYRIGAIT